MMCRAGDGGALSAERREDSSPQARVPRLLTSFLPGNEYPAFPLRPGKIKTKLSQFPPLRAVRTGSVWRFALVHGLRCTICRERFFSAPQLAVSGQAV